jgi:hypothetical protein
MFDGEITITPAPGRYTRAVAARPRPRRTRLYLAAAGVTVATALAAGGIALRLRRLAVREVAPPAQLDTRKTQPIDDPRPITPEPAKALPGAGTTAQGADRAGTAMKASGATSATAAGTVVAGANDDGDGASAARPAKDDEAAGDEAAVRGGKAKGVAAASGVRSRKRSRSHAHKKSGASPQQPPDIDYDAPLPPK